MKLAKEGKREIGYRKLKCLALPIAGFFDNIVITMKIRPRRACAE
jgi:hypothetical protein